MWKIKKNTLYSISILRTHSKSFFIIHFGKNMKLIIKSKFDVLVLNQFHKQKLIEFGVSQERIHIYYNLPIDESNHYDESETVVFGKINKNKGIEELLEAWSSQILKIIN